MNSKSLSGRPSFQARCSEENRERGLGPGQRGLRRGLEVVQGESKEPIGAVLEVTHRPDRDI
eukprot:2458328-Alexandrium_andersonii.AAC.1